jgi:hypothetical protein
MSSNRYDICIGSNGETVNKETVNKETVNEETINEETINEETVNEETINEEWKYINGENKYKIFSSGKIFSYVTNTFLKFTLIERSNLLQTSFLLDGVRKRYYVHRLVYENFVGPIDEKKVIIFKDGNFQNLDYRNLKQVSRNEGENAKNVITFDTSLWKEIQGYEGRYIVSRRGEVGSLLTGKKMIRNLKYNEQYETMLLINTNGKRKQYFVHDLVFFTFSGINFEDKGRRVIDHIDNDRQNNSFENLRLVTYKENNLNRTNYYSVLDQSKVRIKCIDFRNIECNYKGFDFSSYEINSYGQIRNKITERFLKTHFVVGYEHISLRCLKNKKSHSVRIHQLVATMFIENPYNYEIVHHKDSNRGNNYYKNLEWTTSQQNIIYALGRKIAQYDLNDNYIQTFNTLTEASKSLNKGRRQISNVCNGKAKTAYDFKWKWVNE